MNTNALRARERHKKLERMLDKSVLISIHSTFYLIMKVYRGGFEMLIPVLLVFVFGSINLYQIYKKGQIRNYINKDTWFLLYFVSAITVFFIVCIEFEVYPFLILYGVMLVYHIFTGFREGLDTLDEDYVKDYLKKNGVDLKK